MIGKRASTKVVAVFWAIALLCALPAQAGEFDQTAQAPQAPTTGRVAATITTLAGKVHMPGMQVELRDPDRNLVIARTVTDGLGQVMFPDVPARPVHHLGVASRLRVEGFRVRPSGPARRRRCCSTRPLTFVMPEVEVRAEAPSPPTACSLCR